MNEEQDFDDVRENIQQKAEILRWNQLASAGVNFDRLFAATDSLLESSLAAGSYERAFQNDIGTKVLIAYGFLQSLFVMQDAARHLSLAITNQDIRIGDIPELATIRAARNRIAGHPSWANREQADDLGDTSAFFPFHDMKKDGFRAHLYLAEGTTDIYVDVNQWRAKNKDELAKLLRPLLVEIEGRLACVDKVGSP